MELEVQFAESNQNIDTSFSGGSTSDIDMALDELHAYAQVLISGGATE